MLAFYRATLCYRGICHVTVPVRLSVTRRYCTIVSERLEESSWFWHGGFLPPVLHCVLGKFRYLKK